MMSIDDTLMCSFQILKLAEGVRGLPFPGVRWNYDRPRPHAAANEIRVKTSSPLGQFYRMPLLLRAQVALAVLNIAVAVAGALNT